MKLKVLGIALLVMLVAAGCVGQNEAVKTIEVDNGSYQEVNVDEFKTMMENKDFVLVNVHIPFEGDLPQTDLSIPYNEIDQHLGELPAEQDAKIFLYCRSGRMSAEAAEVLANLGYTNVWHLAGGFNAWKAAGNPMAE